MDKKGISIIVLIITVLVTVIIAGAVIVNSTDQLENIKLIVFTSELKDLESQITEYYILNKELPILDGSSSHTKDEVVAFNTNAWSADLDAEITSNNDADKDFYKLDLDKIGVESGNRGFNNTTADFFVFAYPGFNVYYVEGLFEVDTYYFSLTEKLPGYESGITILEDDSVTSTLVSAGIKVNIEKMYTNELNAKIETDIAADETLYLSVTGGDERLITTTIGKNIFSFDSVTEIYDGTAGITVNGLTLTEVQKIDGTKVGNLYNSTGREVDRYIEIIKKKNGTDIGKVKIDLNNYCNINPTILNDVIVENDDDFTTTLTLTEGDCPIKEVRYEYLKKFENSVVVDYFNGVTVLDKEYLLAKGKKTVLNYNESILTTPKDIERVNLIVIDKAGNYTMYEQVTSN